MIAYIGNMTKLGIGFGVLTLLLGLTALIMGGVIEGLGNKIEFHKNTIAQLKARIIWHEKMAVKDKTAEYDLSGHWKYLGT